jgi:8-oxo-dGTP pyrophosphatase MutT (NUDIX family)
MRSVGNLKERIQAVLESRQRRTIDAHDLRPAAILLPLFAVGGQYHILLTKRTDKVKTHKGEISFPGGVYDAEDQTLERTALRESFEEIGLREEDIKILGCLDDVRTLTRYMIRPYVGIFPYPYAFAVNREEIEKMIEIPLPSLLQKDRFEEKRVFLRNGERTIYTYRYREHIIWGATAAILKQFLDLIRGSLSEKG